MSDSYTVGSQILKPGQYSTGISSTQYQGRDAYRIDTSVQMLNSASSQATNRGLDNPIDVEEDGVLIGFTVAVNDPGLQVTCILYGTGTSFTVLNDWTMLYVSQLGRGMTQGVAEMITPEGFSVDNQGVKDDIWPWLQRYKSTPSKSYLNADYSTYKGTVNDRWIVLAYTPSIKEPYTRLVFDITNTTADDRFIHLLQLSRIKFANSTTTLLHDQPSATPARLSVY